MTQEEKAKRYDKAIEKAKAIYQCKYKPDTAAIIAETLQNIFPELKESGDERIRKGLIAIISDFESLYLQENYALSKEDVIAWLETQGVHANFRNGIQIGDKVTCNKDGVLVNLSQLKRVVKPSDYIDTEKQGEKGTNGNEREIPFTDWSEKDETVLNNLIYALANDRIGNNRDEYVDWLKSLKDRYTWKPSDEQMELLREVQQALLGKDCHNRFVNFMYELKRLREE